MNFLRFLRELVGVPLFFLQWLMMGVAVFWSYASRLCHRLHRGTLRHVYYPVVKARRFVLGEDLWKPIDLVFLGIAPRSAAAMEALELYAKETNQEVIWGINEAGDRSSPFLIDKNIPSIRVGDVMNADFARRAVADMAPGELEATVLPLPKPAPREAAGEIGTVDPAPEAGDDPPAAA